MKVISAISGYLLCAVMTMAVTAETTILPEFNVNYDVYRSGIKIARMQRSFSRLEGGNLLYRSETNVTGLVSMFRKDKIIEASTWQLNDGKIIPQLYEYQHTGIKDERSVTVEFDWTQNQITNSINGSSWMMPTAEGILDKLLYQFSIMLDLRAGKSHMTYTIADGGKEKIYVFEPLGEEIIDTPLGKLRTVKLIRHRPDDSDRQSIVWSAPEMGYLPIKFENIDDGVKTVVLINSYSGDESQKVSRK